MMNDYETLATRLENYIQGENQDEVPVRIAEAAAAIRSLLDQIGNANREIEHWKMLVGRADLVQFPFIDDQFTP